MLEKIPYQWFGPLPGKELEGASGLMDEHEIATLSLWAKAIRHYRKNLSQLQPKIEEKRRSCPQQLLTVAHLVLVLGNSVLLQRILPRLQQALVLRSAVA